MGLLKKPRGCDSHREIETTARCAHLARDSVHDAATRVADSIRRDQAATGRPAVSWQTSMPRSTSRSSTCLTDNG